VSGRRPAQAMLLGVAAIAVAIFVVTVPTFRQFFDLGVYRGAVRYWLLDGGDLYDFRYQASVYGFTYPPFAALVFIPLLATSWPVAVGVSVVLNAVAVGVLLRWYLVPILRRNGWPVWTPCAFAFLAMLMFEPSLDTFSFGQVNLALLVLVGADLGGLRAGRRWAGVGIGVATAIKLTPAVFIGYLFVTRRYRAAAVAAGTTFAATAFAAAIAPDSSREFWTGALWDTGRVGDVAYVSNQSLHGAAARLGLSSAWWPAAVAAVLVGWFLLVRRADVVGGFAMTGIVACLVSPITWVHHLVWLLPALFLLLGDALDRRDPRRLAALAAVCIVLSSSVVWLWWAGPHDWVAAIGSNTYVWISIGLLAAVPVSARADTWRSRRRWWWPASPRGPVAPVRRRTDAGLSPGPAGGPGA
jgi:alpha-1,2-mannosyltransferase